MRTCSVTLLSNMRFTDAGLICVIIWSERRKFKLNATVKGAIAAITVAKPAHSIASPTLPRVPCSGVGRYNFRQNRGRLFECFGNTPTYMKVRKYFLSPARRYLLVYFQGDGPLPTMPIFCWPRAKACRSRHIDGPRLIECRACSRQMSPNDF